jgi:hypothetical protein
LFSGLGLEPTDAVRIDWNGEAMPRFGVAMVFQRPLMLRASLHYNVEIALRPMSIHCHERREQARMVLNQAGLGGRSGTNAANMRFWKGAETFINWITSEAGKQAIASFILDGEQLFIPLPWSLCPMVIQSRIRPRRTSTHRRTIGAGKRHRPGEGQTFPIGEQRIVLDLTPEGVHHIASVTPGCIDFLSWNSQSLGDVDRAHPFGNVQLEPPVAGAILGKAVIEIYINFHGIDPLIGH